MSALLEVQSLSVSLPVGGKPRTVVTDVSFSIAPGEAVGLVGESGSGKSMTAKSILRLLPPGSKVGGEIRFGGRSVLSFSREELLEFRASEVAMVFQDPRAATNPVRRIDDSTTEALRFCRGESRDVAERTICGLLRETGIADPERVMRQYPHELSGGLLQRVAVAAALAVRPRLLIADEPTTALDVTTQADVISLLDDLRSAHGAALLFITHDLDLAAAVCDRTVVVYAGRVAEVGASESLHDRPRHPYSAALVASRPSVERAPDRLPVIPGRPQSAAEIETGCPYARRCAFRQQRCVELEPPIDTLEGGQVACWRAEELRETLAEVARIS
jgi:oligopeptide/dipeptide ABC transporter ATP-binding protein